MKNILSFLFIIGVFVLGFSQKTISGVITDDAGKALPSASVTIEEPGKNAILAYGISNTKGEYKISFTTSEENVDIKVKAFNQRTITKSIKNADQNLNFSMNSETTEIQEVRIKTKLITKKGDTISYDLKSFENKADRTLSDVLKKIPGIEVNKDGTVLYQGEPINKFYVNGRDLMEGGYGTINNSLPKDAVSKVEVLENHQPVKILQDKVPSENAALNIKLKKSVTMTGRGEIGAGFSPLLWNLKLTPMFFGQKNQWVVNYKANNNGESVEREGNMLSFGNRWEGRRSPAAQKSWIDVEQAGTPNIPEKRYLMNNVHFLSANLLTSPFKNKEWELKANASYTNNAIERQSTNTTIYSANNSDSNLAGRTIVQKRDNDFYTSAAKGELIFTKNAKKGFFKNTTTFNSYWNNDRAVGNLLTTDKKLLVGDQSLNSPSTMFQNSLSAIVPWKEKLFNVMSYVKYQQDKQTLYASPSNYTGYATGLDSIRSSSFKQYVKSETFEVNHSASVGFSYKKWTFTPEAGLNLSFNKMRSSLFGLQNNSYLSLGSSYLNDIEWNEIQPYTQVGINYKAQALNLNINLPVNFYSIGYQDHLKNQVVDKTKTAFEPSMFASLDFASFFKIWAFANQSYDFGNFGFLYGGDILTNPINISNRYIADLTSNEMPEYLNRSIGSRLEYRNPLNNLFFNVRYNYSTNKRNIMENFITSSGAGGSISLKVEENITKSQTESAEIGKYFPKFKSNISASITNKDSNGFSYFNDVKNESDINSQIVSAKFNNAYFSWFSIDYNISLNWSTNKNAAMIKETGGQYNIIKTQRKNSGWSHNLAAYIYPSDNHTFGFNWDDSTTSTELNKYRNSFFDVSYQYTWVKKKIDFELKWLNISNRKVYEDINVNIEKGFTSINTFNIRPSQFMFTVKFNFK